MEWYRLTKMFSSESCDNILIQNTKSKIPQVLKFLKVQYILSRFSRVAIVLNILLIPLYLCVNKFTDSAIVSYQYGYIISIAYMHGIQITVVLASLILVILTAFVTVLKKCKVLFEENLPSSMDRSNVYEKVWYP